VTRMCHSCVFLESKPGIGRVLLCCAAGVNFYAVGQARELCRLCPLSAGEWTPTCKFLEVYAFLRGKKSQQRIEIQMDCWLPGGRATLPCCATCPAAGAPIVYGNGTPEAQLVQTPLREDL